MPALPGISTDLDWAASITGPVMVKGTGTAYVFTGTAATGITDVDYPTLTTRGIAYLDGTYYVMEPDGTIWNSLAAADDPSSWPTDGFISAEFEPDTGVYLGKALNYVVAFGQWTVELFWDAANPTGSPLSPVQNGVLLIGCAAAGSVAQTESTLMWVAQRKAQASTQHQGKFVAVLVGQSYEEVSTPDISRVLESADMAQVYSCIMELGGHSWYILTLKSLNITLVYDIKNKQWYVWTRLAVGTAVTVSGMGQVNGLATGTATYHGMQDGDPAVVSGVTPAGFNGTFNMKVTGANTFQYTLSTTGTSTGTGASKQVTPFVESAFDLITTVGFGGIQLGMDVAGNVYELTLGQALDNGDIPLNWRIRTVNLDQGNNERKFCSSLALNGDIATSETYGLVRNTDDDYQTYGYFRRFDLSDVRINQQRWGNYRRRAWEWRYTGSQRWRLKSLEPEIKQGVT